MLRLECLNDAFAWQENYILMVLGMAYNNFILILLHMYFYEKPNKSLSNKSFTIVAKFSILDVCQGPAYAFKLTIFSWLLALKFVTWFRN